MKSRHFENRRSSDQTNSNSSDQAEFEPLRRDEGWIESEQRVSEAEVYFNRHKGKICGEFGREIEEEFVQNSIEKLSSVGYDASKILANHLVTDGGLTRTEFDLVILERGAQVEFKPMLSQFEPGSEPDEKALARAGLRTHGEQMHQQAYWYEQEFGEPAREFWLVMYPAFRDQHERDTDRAASEENPRCVRYAVEKQSGRLTLNYEPDDSFDTQQVKNALLRSAYAFPAADRERYSIESSEIIG